MPRTRVRRVGQESASLQAFGLLCSSGKGLIQGMWTRARRSNYFKDYKRLGLFESKYSGTPYAKMSSGTPRAHGAASRIGPDALATLETGLAPVRPVRVARTSLAASGSSDADISLRLEQVTKSNRF